MGTETTRWDLVVVGGDRAGRDVSVEAASRGARVALVIPGAAPTGDVIGNDQVRILTGIPQFRDPRTIEVACRTGGHELVGETVVIGTGSRPYRPQSIPFDDVTILDADGFERAAGSRRVAIVGAGRDGLRCAALLATAGVEVVVFDRRRRLLEECDSELADSLIETMVRDRGIELRLGEDVTACTPTTGRTVSLELTAGNVEHVEQVIVCMGRIGNTESVRLDRVGLETDERGRLWCDERFRTAVDPIRAVGSVIGFPAALRTSLDQGTRCAVDVLFAGSFDNGVTSAVSSSGTTPEIVQTGRTTEDLIAAGVDFQSGRSWEAAGSDETNRLKLLWNRKSSRVLGAHGIGPDVARSVGRVAGAIRRRLTVDRLLSIGEDDRLLRSAATAEALVIEEAVAQASVDVSAWRIDSV